MPGGHLPLRQPPGIACNKAINPLNPINDQQNSGLKRSFPASLLSPSTVESVNFEHWNQMSNRCNFSSIVQEDSDRSQQPPCLQRESGGCPVKCLTLLLHDEQKTRSRLSHTSLRILALRRSDAEEVLTKLGQLTRRGLFGALVHQSEYLVPSSPTPADFE